MYRQLKPITIVTGLLITAIATGSYLYTQAQIPLPDFFGFNKEPQKTASCSPVSSNVLPVSTEERIINADLIRVGISNNQMEDFEYPTTVIAGTGNFSVYNKATNAPIASGLPRWDAVTVTVNNQGFQVSKKSGVLGRFKGPIVFRPDNTSDNLRILNTTRRGKNPEFRNEIEITRASSSPAKLSVVNVLPLQDYLRAVVPNELPMRYGVEAVKAQSIAARNYALRPRNKVWPQFDICDSQYCQAYYGAQTETPGSDATLASTDGLVALYDGEIILALYSSAHGGFGEAYANAFSDPDTKQFPAPNLPYLAGGPDIVSAGLTDLSSEAAARQFWTRKYPSFDEESTYLRWERVWSRPTMEAVINKQLIKYSKDNLTKDFIYPHLHQGQSIGRLKRINVIRRGVSGKVMEAEIHGSNGVWKVKKEFVVRKIFAHNNRMLPSANIVFSHLTDQQGNLVSIKVNGGGFGHGVGMSQLGASYMSKRGKRFPEIIQHYYKGVSIGSVPIKVGKDGYLQPARNTFMVEQPRGILNIKSDGCDRPVKIKLNEQTLTLTTDANGNLTKDVSQLLRPGAKNSIVVYPDNVDGHRPIKAWVELYPPRQG